MLVLDKDLLYKIRKKELEQSIMRINQYQCHDLGNPWFVQRWTPGAIDCYKRGCVCRDCPVQNLMKSQKCRMKTAVIELVRKFGVPQNANIQNY